MRLLIDLRTGEPVIDLEGSLKEIDIERSFRQYIDALLHTPILSEQFIPTWGLDVRGIIEASASPMWESLIKYLITNALSPRVEPLISQIESIELDRTTPEELLVSIHVKSNYGTTSVNTVSLNV